MYLNLNEKITFSFYKQTNERTIKRTSEQTNNNIKYLREKPSTRSKITPTANRLKEITSKLKKNYARTPVRAPNQLLLQTK